MLLETHLGGGCTQAEATPGLPWGPTRSRWLKFWQKSHFTWAVGCQGSGVEGREKDPLSAGSSPQAFR